MKQDWLLVTLVALVAALGLFYQSGVHNLAGLASQQPRIQQAFPNCMDTDLGFYPAQQGSTYDKYADYNNFREDYCSNQNTLVEYFCDEYGINSEEVACLCQNGVCL